MGQTLQDILSDIYSWATTPLFTVGESAFTATSILKLILFVILVLVAARWLQRILQHRILTRFSMEPGVRYALSTMAYYLVLVTGLFVGLQTSGINLSALAVVAGALGVGIGIGLQEIVANFVSGLIILTERPVQVGDRVQIGDLHGKVTRIRMRATDVVTNDNIAVIVPNRDFISQQVTNWSVGGDTIRIHVPVGVSYGSDPETVRSALLEAARSVPEILDQPPPHVRLTDFGDSSINFSVLVWTRQLLHQPNELRSRLNFAIHKALKQHGIEIPFPQRDLHLKSAVPLPVAGGEGSVGAANS